MRREYYKNVFAGRTVLRYADSEEERRYLLVRGFSKCTLSDCVEMCKLARKVRKNTPMAPMHVACSDTYILPAGAIMMRFISYDAQKVYLGDGGRTPYEIDAYPETTYIINYDRSENNG